MKFDLSLDEIKYIKVKYLDSDSVGHIARATIKRLNEREIFACVKLIDNTKILFPQEVEISFACDNALYKANTCLKSVENDDPYVYLIFKTPTELEYQQNREYFRVRMDENVLLSFNGNVIPCKIYDISASGIKLRLDNDIVIPQKVTLNIMFSPKNVNTQAKFIRIDEEEGVRTASFAFENMTESNRDIISQKCIQKQLNDKRRSLL